MIRERLARFPLQMDDKVLLLIIAALIAFAILRATLNLPTYYLILLANILIFGILALGYNLLHGHTGLLSFGHAGFYLMGAYAGAITLQLTGGNVWLGFLGALVISTAFAFIVGFIAVRIRGIYFALITLAFSMIPYLAILRIRGALRELSGGHMGLHLGYPPPFIFDLGNPLLFFFFTLGVFIAVYIIMRIIINSNFGQSLKCVKDNELKLEGLGYNTRRLKYIAVTISGSFGGLAGYLYLLSNLSINPTLGNYYISVKIIVVSLIGGVNSIIGPLLGTFVWYGIERFLVVPGFLEITLGVTLVIVILRLPFGITGLIKRIKR